MQSEKKIPNIALVGNPNSGKSSLFNILTGLRQHVGNYAGVTVDKKIGTCTLDNQTVNIIDLPGTYSLYPKSGDEFVAYDALFDPIFEHRPQLIVVLVDASNLRRNLLFCTQIIDLGIPVVVALTMVDIATKKGTAINTELLSAQLGVPICSINPRKGKGIATFKSMLQNCLQEKSHEPKKEIINSSALAPELLPKAQQLLPHLSAYGCVHALCDAAHMRFVSNSTQLQLQACASEYGFNKTKVQGAEIIQRYAFIKNAMKESVVEADPLQKEKRTERIDKLLLHPLWGNLILLFVLFILFQSVYWLAAYPMQWIDSGFSQFTAFAKNYLPQHALSNLLTDGLLAGLGGILVFVPQIMILFGLITMLEDSGYMARISFLTDRLMRSVGLNGKAILPLISGMACAVPAIMSARTIESKKEKLITILITPLMSCSARLPVYTILIALVIPRHNYFGFISLQGLVMMGLYLLGFIVALLVAKLLDLFIKMKHKSVFLMELPVYRAPRWQNVGITMIEKAKIFVRDAGKVIMVISVVLWVLCNYGPSQKRQELNTMHSAGTITHVAYETQMLEHSYAGIVGKAIEPLIKPLGYDWKIGIALITSFAAREVFVGTMSTLYSAASNDDDTATLQEKMRNATDSNGVKVYTLASGVSLLLFYVFAMQCMSTLAIVRKETGSWKFPIIQFAYMGLLAYGFAWLAYKILS